MTKVGQVSKGRFSEQWTEHPPAFSSVAMFSDRVFEDSRHTYHAFKRWPDTKKAKTASGNGRQFGQDGHGWKRVKSWGQHQHTDEC
jgi:hypothetical protein